VDKDNQLKRRHAYGATEKNEIN